MANETINGTIANTTTPVQDMMNAASNPVDTVSEQLHLWLRNGIEATGQPFLINLIGNPYLFAAFSIIAGFLVAYVLVFLSQTVIKAFTSRTKTDLDDILLERLRHPVALSLFVFFISVALIPLSLNSALATALNRIIMSGNVLLIGVIVNRVVSTLFEHYGKKIAATTDSAVDDHLLPIIRKVVTAVIYSIAILIILAVWGVQVAPLLAGAGIAGIAIAFALQETLKNMFGGVSLAFDRAYAVGDRIKLSDGTVGTVLDITLRSTKIRTFDGDLIVVPNGKIANENFQTYAQPTHETRVVVQFGVVYGSDIEKVKKTVLTAIKGIPHQINTPERDMEMKVQFVEMGAYSLNFRAIFWVDDYRVSYDAKLDATDRIYAAMNKAKIEFAYPTQVIYTKR